MKPGPQIDRVNAAPAGGPTTLRDIGKEPEQKGGSGAPAEPQAQINAAKPDAAVQTPADPTGAASQAAEKAADGQTTKEKREDVSAMKKAGTETRD